MVQIKVDNQEESKVAQIGGRAVQLIQSHFGNESITHYSISNRVVTVKFTPASELEIIFQTYDDTAVIACPDLDFVYRADTRSKSIDSLFEEALDNYTQYILYTSTAEIISTVLITQAKFLGSQATVDLEFIDRHTFEMSLTNKDGFRFSKQIHVESSLMKFKDTMLDLLKCDRYMNDESKLDKFEKELEDFIEVHTFKNLPLKEVK